MDTVLSIFSGGLTGALIVLFLRNWISERLQQSIRHEYSQKLETHKAELNTRIQAIQHENQLQRLRTSLFFDHQRNAFAGILSKIAEVNQAWIEKECEEEVGLTGPVPLESYKELRATFYKHQLFFDNACLAAVELILDYYSNSFPSRDGSGRVDSKKINAAYDAVYYLQPRLAELFQNRIGVSNSRRAEREIALLGAIKILNAYHFDEIGLPPKENLKFDRRDEAAEAVAKAESHYEELMEKLGEFEKFLKTDRGFFHEAALKTTRYLEMLSEKT